MDVDVFEVLTVLREREAATFDLAFDAIVIGRVERRLAVGKHDAAGTGLEFGETPKLIQCQRAFELQRAIALRIFQSSRCFDARASDAEPEAVDFDPVAGNGRIPINGDGLSGAAAAKVQRDVDGNATIAGD